MDDANPVVKQGGRVTGFVSYGQRAFLKGAADFCFIKGGDFMTRRKICSLLVMLVVTLFASSAMASYVIDFGIRANTGTDSGTISYNGTNGLVGTNIEVDEFSLDGGPIYSLINGILQFNTGNLISYNDTDPSGRIWTFGGGGDITIIGDVAGHSGVTLLDGEWLSVRVVEVVPLSVLKLEVVAGGFTDEKNKLLLYELGLIGNPGAADEFVGPFAGSLNLSFSIPGSATTECFDSLDIFSGDVVNAPVPIPGAVWLLGSGIVGLLVVRRKLKK